MNEPIVCDACHGDTGHVGQEWWSGTVTCRSWNTATDRQCGARIHWDGTKVAWTQATLPGRENEDE